MTRFKIRFVLTTAIVSVVAAGCGRETKPAPKTLTLYSLSPNRVGRDKGKRNRKEIFHGYRIIGKVEIKDEEARQEIFNALHDGIDNKDGRRMDCFEPRHGIRTVENGKNADYVICYKCLNISLYKDGSRKYQRKYTTRDPATVLNKHLKAAGISLSP